MTTKILNVPEEPRRELPLLRPVPPQDVPLDTIIRRTSMLGAINLMLDVAAHEDKELYTPLKIDAGHWSKMRTGKAQFPVDGRLNQVMDMCNSSVPLIWLAHSRGMGVHMLETEAETQLRRERELRIDAEKRVELLTSILKRQA